MHRFFRYFAVGAVATAAHYAVLVLCVRAFGWPAFVGSGVGAAVGAQVAFVGNRGFTFGHVGPVWRAWRRFQATAALGAVVGMAVVAAGVATGLHYLLAQVVATAVGLVLTFVVNRAWAFAVLAARAGQADCQTRPRTTLAAARSRVKSLPPR